MRISIDLFFQIQIIKLRNKGKKEADVMNVFHVYKSVFILFTSVKFWTSVLSNWHCVHFIHIKPYDVDLYSVKIFKRKKSTLNT